MVKGTREIEDYWQISQDMTIDKVWLCLANICCTINEKHNALFAAIFISIIWTNHFQDTEFISLNVK